MAARRGTTTLRCLALGGGLLLACSTVPLAEVVVLFVIASSVAGLSIVLVTGDLADADDGATGADLRTVVARACAAGVVAVSLAALATVSALLALVALVALLSCSPGIRDVVRNYPRRVRELALDVPATAVVPPPVVPRQRGDLLGLDRVGSLTSRQLRTAWSQTYEALQGSMSTLERTSLVEWRRTCLDEMEKRDPAAVAAWFDAGADQTSGPDESVPPS